MQYAEVGSNELHITSLHLLEYIFWVTNTFRVYFKMGTFYAYSSIFLEKKTVLLLRYCGRLSSRYFILMKYKLKMLQFIPTRRLLFSGQ